MSRTLFEVSVSGTSGNVKTIPVFSGTTSQSILVRVLNIDNPRKAANYVLVQTIKNSRGFVQEKKQLDPNFLVATLEPFYRRKTSLSPSEEGASGENGAAKASDDEGRTISLSVARKDQFVYVYFNVFCRMMTGAPLPCLPFYYGKVTSVDQLEAAIRDNIGLPRDDRKFGLFGSFPDGGVKKLGPTDLVINLSDVWDPKKGNAFFQFQILPEFVDNSILGATISGELFKVSKKVFTLKAKRWLVLKGTTLYMYDHPGDSKPIHQFDSIHLCNVGFTAQPTGRAPGYEFQIFHPLKTLTLLADKLDVAEDWVKHLRSCEQCTEFRIPETSRELVKPHTVPITVEQEEKPPSLSDNSASQAEDYFNLLNFYDEENEGVVDKRTDELLDAISQECQMLLSTGKSTSALKTRNLVLLVRTFLGEVVQLRLGPYAENVVAQTYDILVQLKLITSKKEVVALSPSETEITLQTLQSKCRDLGLLTQKIRKAIAERSVPMDVDERHKVIVEKLKRSLLKNVPEEEESNKENNNNVEPDLLTRANTTVNGFKKSRKKRGEQVESAVLLSSNGESQDLNLIGLLKTRVRQEENQRSLSMGKLNSFRKIDEDKMDELTPKAKSLIQPRRRELPQVPLRESSLSFKQEGASSVSQLQKKYETVTRQYSTDLYSCKPCCLCSDPVLIEDAIYASFSVYHSKCFNCTNCHVPLKLSSHSMLPNGHPKCKGECAVAE